MHRSNAEPTNLQSVKVGVEERAAAERAVQERGVGVLRQVEPAVAERALGEDRALVGGLGEVDADEGDPGVLLTGEVLAVPVGLPDLGLGRRACIAQPCSTRLATRAATTTGS